MAASTRKSPADVLADFKVSAPPRVTYVEREGATRTDVPSVSESAYVTVGKHAKNGVPVLLLCDGSTRQALPLSCIGAAIAGGTVTREQVEALLS